MLLHRYDYHRSAFGDSWDDNNHASPRHNACDIRDDILTCDFVDNTLVSIKRCPSGVATCTLYDSYIDQTIAFQRGAKVDESVQIDHMYRSPMPGTWGHTVGRIDSCCGLSTIRSTC